MNSREYELSKSSLRKRTALGLSVLLLFFVGCLLGWKWLHKQPDENGTPAPLRAALNSNEKLFSGMFEADRLTKTFSKKDAVITPRVNGSAGMSDGFDPANWRLNLLTGKDTLKISLEELKKIKKTEVIFDFKCIEGWSQVSHWGGIRFSDFVKHYKLENEIEKQFGGFETPDGEYYVGVDMKSLMHPQTLLCYELNDKDLPLKHGAPLRLIIPVKYGVKHIKRIGTMYFSDSRPRDYWYERGYDYYCGL